MDPVPVILAILPSASPYSQLYFILFKANLGEYGSYSLHICMFQYIRKHHLFALFASYSLQMFAQIRIKIFYLIEKNTCNFLILANICFKIFV